MKRISFLLFFIYLCLTTVSCKKVFHPKTVYWHYEIMKDGEFFSGDIDCKESVLGKGPYLYGIHFTRDAGHNPYCEIELRSTLNPGFELNMYVLNKESDQFLDGKEYSFSKTTEKPMCATELFFDSCVFMNFEQAVFRFDLIEQDGLSYSFSFDYSFSHNASPSHRDDLPHSVKGRIDVYNSYHVKKRYETFIKKE